MFALLHLTNQSAMFRYRLFLLMCSFISLELCAINLGSEAYDGLVVTKVDTIHGKVEVDLVRNIVKVRSGSKYYNMVASQVKKVIVYEPGFPRSYFSGSFGPDNQYILFEILSTGKVNLLFREGVKFSQFDEEAFPPFFISRDNSIYSVSTKKEFLSHLDQRAEEVKAYLKQNKTSFGSKADLVALFDFYNGISKASEMFAFEN